MAAEVFSAVAAAAESHWRLRKRRNTENGYSPGGKLTLNGVSGVAKKIVAKAKGRRQYRRHEAMSAYLVEENLCQ